MQGTRRMCGDDLVFVRVLFGIVLQLDLHMLPMFCFSPVLLTSPQSSTYTPLCRVESKEKRKGEVQETKMIKPSLERVRARQGKRQ